uniref:Uncharacterized protein n=1 Tax=Opuntia streptacantha TaxID=393608 RepID=A0A7C8YXB9_OPUST
MEISSEFCSCSSCLTSDVDDETSDLGIRVLFERASSTSFLRLSKDLRSDSERSAIKLLSSLNDSAGCIKALSLGFSDSTIASAGAGFSAGISAGAASSGGGGASFSVGSGSTCVDGHSFSVGGDG